MRLPVPRALVGLWLVFALVAGPAGVAAQPAGHDPGAAVSAAALARTEARKERALARLAAERGRIDQAAEAEFRRAIERRVRDRLAAVRAVFDDAKTRLTESFGLADAASNLWTQMFADDAAREAWFRDRVTKALDDAGYGAAIAAFSAGVEADLTAIALARYREHQARVEAILYDAVAEDGLLGTAAAAAFDSVKSELRRLKVAQSIEDPTIGAVEVPAAVPDKLLLGIVSKLVMKGIGRAMLTRAGTMLGGQIVAKVMAAPVLGPVGLAVGAAALAWDVSELTAAMAGAVTETIDQMYQNSVAGTVLAPAFLDTLTAATVASLTEQVAADLEMAHEVLDSFFFGIFEQAQSPGYQAFQAGQDSAASFEALRKVSLVFGRSFIELPFAEKYRVAAALPTPAVRAAMAIDGRTFLDLYADQPAMVERLVAAADHGVWLRFILTGGAPRDDLVYFDAARTRFGDLSGPQAAALRLIRRAHPGLAPAALSKPVLELVGAHADRLGRIARDDPDAGARVLGWLADGALSYALFDTVLRGPDPAVHLAVMAALGPEAYHARVVRPGHHGGLAGFVAAHGQERAVRLLSDPGVDYLAVHGSLGGGGVRAVEVTERLRQDYSGDVPAETLRLLDWVLTAVPIDPDAIDRRYLDQLAWLGIADYLPDLIAVPLAEIVSVIDWPVRAFVYVALGLIALMLGLPVARLLVRGVVRQLRPATRRSSRHRREPAPAAPAPPPAPVPPDDPGADEVPPVAAPAASDQRRG